MIGVKDAYRIYLTEYSNSDLLDIIEETDDSWLFFNDSIAEGVVQILKTNGAMSILPFWKMGLGDKYKVKKHIHLKSLED